MELYFQDKVDSENMASGNAQADHADNPSELLSAEQRFLKALHSFMCDRNTPIARIPHLGFKKSKTHCCETSLKLFDTRARNQLMGLHFMNGNIVWCVKVALHH